MSTTSMPPHQLRVVEEKAELSVRTEKLGEFLGTALFSKLGVNEQGRLRRQFLIMRLYEQVLNERITNF